MTGLSKTLSSSIALTLSLATALAPVARAEAAPPLPVDVERDDATQVEAEGGEFAPAPVEHDEAEQEGGQALRIVAEDPSAQAQPEGPGLELAEPSPEPPAPTAVAPTPSPTPTPRPAWTGKRPMPGTGLIAFGAMGLGASSMMLIAALAGPGWGDMSKRRAAILGGAALPTALASGGMLGAGIKSHGKFEKWERQNSLSAPEPGNGFIVVGAGLSVGGALATGFATQEVLERRSPSRGAWVPVGFSAALAVVGLLTLGSGMAMHSKFKTWERNKLMPGTMAMRGGGGLTIAGRF